MFSDQIVEDVLNSVPTIVGNLWNRISAPEEPVALQGAEKVMQTIDCHLLTGFCNLCRWKFRELIGKRAPNVLKEIKNFFYLEMFWIEITLCPGWILCSRLSLLHVVTVSKKLSSVWQKTDFLSVTGGPAVRASFASRNTYWNRNEENSLVQHSITCLLCLQLVNGPLSILTFYLKVRQGAVPAPPGLGLRDALQGRRVGMGVGGVVCELAVLERSPVSRRPSPSLRAPSELSFFTIQSTNVLWFAIVRHFLCVGK